MIEKNGGLGAAEPGAGAAVRPPGRPHPADYVFLLRPMILVPVWTFFLLGARHGALAGGVEPKPAALVAGILSFTALIGAVYVVNQIADRDTDREGGKLFLLADGIVSIRAAWIEAALLAAASFGLAAAFLPRAFLAILAASLALGAAYSLEPARLKRRPVLDVLANAAGNGVLNTLAGWVAVGAPLAGWQILAPYPLAVASVHLATTLADRGADERTGLRTSGVALGERRGILAATALMGASALAGRLAGNGWALAASLLSLPFFLVPERGPQTEAPPSRFLLPAKAATLIFSIVAGYLFPVYLPCLAAAIALTRLYYAKRFGMAYPSLRSPR